MEFNDLIESKKEKLNRLEVLENELIEKEFNVKNVECNIFLSDVLKNKGCTNSDTRKAFLTRANFADKKRMAIIKNEIKALEREIKLVDQLMSYELKKMDVDL